MDLIVEKVEKISGDVSPSPSKFHTQLASAIGLLADGKSVIENPLVVDDTRDLAKAIEDMGGTTKRSEESWSIWGNGPSITPEGQVVDAKKSLTNLSFLAGISTLTSRIMVVTGKKQIRNCPVPSLLKFLKKIGIDIHSSNRNETPPLIVFESQINGGEITLEEDDLDSRFLPALLLLSPLAEKEVKIKYNSKLEGRFLDNSLTLLEKSGIKTNSDDRLLTIKQGEFKPIEVTPPLDMISTIPYVAGAILTESKITITKTSEAINFEEFVDILKRIGIKTEEKEDSLKIPNSQNPKPSTVDLHDFPELLPFLAVLACKANGKTKIINASKARQMKSDRIKATVEGLNKLGADVIENEDGITIEGPCKLKGTTVDGREDNAIVASLGMAGLIAEGKTVIKNRAEALRQTYPQFVTVFKDLGANMSYKS